MWFGSIWAWITALFVERTVDKMIDGQNEHIEPEEGDWDESESPDASQDLENLVAVIKESDAALFFGDISKFVQRGFGPPQITVLLNKLSRIPVGEKWFVEYNVKAFGRGTPLQVATQQLDGENIGVIVWTEPVLAFEIGGLIPDYEQSRENSIPNQGLN